MQMTATNDSLISLGAARSASVAKRPMAVGRTFRGRQISPEAGRAIEMLGHAIEYLADEFALDCMDRRELLVAGNNPRVEAIELLKARNREVYFSCPEVPTLGERLRAWVRLRMA
jgi:hypothetical protein